MRMPVINSIPIDGGRRETFGHTISCRNRLPGPVVQTTSGRVACVRQALHLPMRRDLALIPAKDLNSRYLSEDTLTRLFPAVSRAHHFGVKTPVLERYQTFAL